MLYFYYAALETTEGTFDIEIVDLTLSLGIHSGSEMDQITYQTYGYKDSGDGSYLCYAWQLERHGFPSTYTYLSSETASDAAGTDGPGITYHHIMINEERYRIVAHKYVIIALIRE